MTDGRRRLGVEEEFHARLQAEEQSVQTASAEMQRAVASLKDVFRRKSQAVLGKNFDDSSSLGDIQIELERVCAWAGFDAKQLRLDAVRHLCETHTQDESDAAQYDTSHVVTDEAVFDRRKRVALTLRANFLSGIERAEPQIHDARVRYERTQALPGRLAPILNAFCIGTDKRVLIEDGRLTIHGGQDLRMPDKRLSSNIDTIAAFSLPEFVQGWGLSEAQQAELQHCLAVIQESSQKTREGSHISYAHPAAPLSSDQLRRAEQVISSIAPCIEKIYALKQEAARLTSTLVSMVRGEGFGQYVGGGKGPKEAPPDFLQVDDAEAFLSRLEALGLQDTYTACIEAFTLEWSIRKWVYQSGYDNGFAHRDFSTVPLEKISADLMRVRETIEDVKIRYFERKYLHLQKSANVSSIIRDGYTFDHLLEDEESVQRLFDEFAQYVPRLQTIPLSDSALAELEVAVDAYTAALDRKSADGQRFSNARLLLIHAKNVAINEIAQDRQRLIEIQEVLRPVEKYEYRLRRALQSACPQYDDGVRFEIATAGARFTGEERSELQEAHVLIQELHAFRNRTFQNVDDVRKAVQVATLDTEETRDEVERYIQAIGLLVQHSRARLANVEPAFEFLKGGTFETNTPYHVTFTRDAQTGIFTFEIPERIRSERSRTLGAGAFTGRFPTLAAAVAAVNAGELEPPTQITVLDERASEQEITDALALRTAQEAASKKEKEPQRTPYRGARRGVKRILAAAFGSALGFFVPVPDAPQRTPMHDTGARPDARLPGEPVIEADKRQVVPGAKDGPKIIVPGYKGSPEIVIPPLPDTPRVFTNDGKQTQDVVSPPKIEIRIINAELSKHFTTPITQEHGTYALLHKLRTYMAQGELTEPQRRATDWFTHAVARYINESPEERIGFLTNVPMKKGVIASTIPKKVGNVSVELQFGNILKRADFWQWFDAFYEKRKATTLSRPGLASAIDALSAQLKQDFKITQ